MGPWGPGWPSAVGGGEGNGPHGNRCPRLGRHSTCRSLLWAFLLFGSELQPLTSAAVTGPLSVWRFPSGSRFRGVFGVVGVAPRARGSVFCRVSHGDPKRVDRAGAFGGGCG